MHHNEELGPWIFYSLTRHYKGHGENERLKFHLVNEPIFCFHVFIS